jgi:DNA repair protein SbcC/Rad50
MRPRRLELAGYTAFREPVEIDFNHADLFALCGPTGSGKSSIIDAMCFALFGTVPRLDRRAVAPVISAGRLEARVRFDFTVGEQPYTAVRVVRRTKQGATTKEARLEAGGEVLAGDPAGMTQAVEGLLGLGFEQFTKCVVLPQGDFARFLHDPPKDRQDLLVRLLDLSVYERMRQAANTRAAAVSAHADVLAAELERLADATPAGVAASEGRLRRLADLRDEVDGLQEQLDGMERERAEAAADAAAAAERAAALERIAPPTGLDELARDGAEARAARARARADAESAERRVAAAEAMLADLPGKDELAAVRDRHAERARQSQRSQRGKAVLAQTAEAAEAAAREAAASEQGVRDAEDALDELRRRHAAHELAAHVTVGAPCPVCDQEVVTLPARAPLADLDEAQARLASARAARKATLGRLQTATADHAKAEQTMRTVVESIAELDAVLAGAPGPGEVDRLLGTVGEAAATLAAAREADRTARAALRLAEETLEAAHRRAEAAWGVFDAARDGVGALAPPPVDRGDLGRSWGRLVEWAAARAPQERDAAEAATARAQALAEEAAKAGRHLRDRCADVGVDVGDRRPRDACVEALADARAALERVTAAVERAREVRAAVETQREAGAVAHTLGQHLSANRFERWLLDEALQRLASGGSDILRELSGGQYSLEIDAQRNFAVVDHRNADERRPARTLSGGETFLASLALALTLADHLAELAVRAAPKLESIFLDEGFGTLDAETLDVVAAAIEELGAAGRTVGIVTHVRDLAERVPVRYEVRRTPAGSTVEQVVA